MKVGTHVQKKSRTKTEKIRTTAENDIGFKGYFIIRERVRHKRSCMYAFYLVLFSISLSLSLPQTRAQCTTRISGEFTRFRVHTQMMWPTQY